MTKRIQLTMEQIERLAEGSDVEFAIGLKRRLVLGTKSDKDIKKEVLKARYEAKIAGLDSK